MNNLRSNNLRMLVHQLETRLRFTPPRTGNQGFCSCCRQRVFFEIRGPWLRDQYICQQCGSIPRQRHIMHALDVYFPEWPNASIHESSPTVNYISQCCKGYTSSQLLEGVTPGQTFNGVRCEDLEQLTFPSDSFDLFITQDVMEHVFDPQRALTEVMRVVREGGAYVFTAPRYRGMPRTAQRAKLETGRIVHLAEPEYHGNPVGDGRSLVTWHYGDDFEALIWRWCGYPTTTLITRDPSLGLAGEFIDVFIVRKIAR